MLVIWLAGVLAWQAAFNAPTQDEPAHLVASVALAQTGDPGFYRVNPPASKWLTGIWIELVRPINPGPMPPASAFPSGFRKSSRLADQYLARSLSRYRYDFMIARIPRLLATVMLLAWSIHRLPTSGASRIVLATLFCTSPMVMGHGWTIMPDALSCGAMAVLLVACLGWLKSGSGKSLVGAGIAWGLAISIKFTFCPAYLLWPLAIAIYQGIGREFSFFSFFRNVIGHLLQGLIALVVVIAFYGGREVAVPLGEHDFVSQRMEVLFENSALAGVWSPFHKQFLVGIDEQQLDLEKGYPTYVHGVWYPEGVWWYYLFGIAAKESLACWLAFAVVPLGTFCLFKVPSIERRREPATSVRREVRQVFGFCVVVTTIVVFILSVNSKMALNVRYALPALPPLYFALALTLGALIERFKCYRRRVLVSGFVVVAVVESAFVFPHHFAYINPVLGGATQTPLVLHDSNFDGGQDLWRLEEAIESGRWQRSKVYVIANTKVPRRGFRLSTRSPDALDFHAFVRQWHSQTKKKPKSIPETVLVISRGFEAPMRWTTQFGQREEVSLEIQEFLRHHPPDEYFTPTLAVYCLEPSQEP